MTEEKKYCETCEAPLRNWTYFQLFVRAQTTLCFAMFAFYFVYKLTCVLISSSPFFK
jgi:hypothetical protein